MVTHTRAHMHARTHTHTHTHMHACMHACTPHYLTIHQDLGSHYWPQHEKKTNPWILSRYQSQGHTHTANKREFTTVCVSAPNQPTGCQNVNTTREWVLFSHDRKILNAVLWRMHTGSSEMNCSSANYAVSCAMVEKNILKSNWQFPAIWPE